MANRFGEALRNNLKESENRVEQAISGQPAAIVNNEQPISDVNKQMQQLAQPALVYEAEATKGISVKIPYTLYDALDAIKKQTQRTGNPRDKMGIGDLVVLAVKEFVERNGVG